MKNSPFLEFTLPSKVLMFFALTGGVHAQLPANPNHHHYGLDRSNFKSEEPGSESENRTAFLSSQNVYFNASISAGVRYDDNIFLDESNEVEDVIWSVTPSFVLNNGGVDSAEHTLELRYTPSFQFYTDNTDRNTIDQFVGLYYGLNLAKTRVRASLSFSDTSGSNRFVGGTVDETFLDTRITVNHILSEKTRIDMSAGTRISIFDDSTLIDNDQSSLNVGLAYAYSPKLELGVDVGYTNDSVDRGLDQEAVDVGISTTYIYSPKTRITGRVGYAIRSFDDGFSDLTEPTWSLSATHEATAKTRIYGRVGQELKSFNSGIADSTDITWELGGVHRISDFITVNGSVYRASNPALNIEDAGFVATGVKLALNYQFSALASLGVSGAYENDDYFETGANAVDLDNDYYVFELNLNRTFSNGLILAAFTRWQEQTSNEIDNDFSNFTFGLNARYNLW